MQRTLDNCALIKKNLESGRDKPGQNKGLCEGYIHRGKVHKTCAHCDLYINMYKNRK